MVADNRAEAVEVEVRLEPRDYVRFNFWHIFHPTGTRVRLAGAVLFAVGLGFAGCALTGNARFLAQFLLLVLLALYASLFTLFVLLLPLGAKKSYGSNKLLREPTRWTFSRGVVAAESALGSSRHNWDVYWQAHETKGAFYFYLANNLCQVIPKRSFTSDEQLQRFREIARAALDPKACRI